jgi:hypothetical protein
MGHVPQCWIRPGARHKPLFLFPNPNYTIGVSPQFIAPDLDLFRVAERLELWFADAAY